MAILEEAKIAEKASLKKRVLSSVFWFGATKTAGQAASWAITIYVARVLSPGDYGLIGMSGIFTGLMLMINELGLGSAIVQRKGLAEDDLTDIFWIVALMNTSLYLVFVLSAPLIAAFFHEPRLVPVVRVISVTFVISCVGYIPYYMLTKELKFDKRSKAEFAGNLSAGLATLFFAVRGFGVWSLVYGSIILELTKNVLLVIYYPWRPRLSFSLSRVKTMVDFGLKITGSRIFWYAYSNADFLIAGKVLGKTLLGFYSMAFQFASVPLDKVISIITQVTLPAFSEIQDDTERVNRYFLKIVRISAFITFPLFMGIFLVADDAVRFFLTEKWAPLVLPLKILCIVSTFRAVNAINGPILIATGKPGISMYNNLLFAIVLPVSFYLGSFYGLEGFSYSWLFAFPVLFIITTYISLKAVGISLLTYLSELKDVFFGTVFMVAAVILSQRLLLTGLSSLGRISGTCMAGVSSYFLYYALFRRDIFLEARSILKR